jgi:hypothetical protein
MVEHLEAISSPCLYDRWQSTKEKRQGVQQVSTLKSRRIVKAAGFYGFLLLVC